MAEIIELGGAMAFPAADRDNRIVLAAVFDTDQPASPISPAPPMAGAVLIATCTCDPERMPELARRAMEKHNLLIEAPLSGTSEDLADGNAVFLLGGDVEKTTELDWLRRILGRAYRHVGDIGNGNRAKLAVHLVLSLNRAALAEELVFARSIGLEPRDILLLLQDTAAASTVVASKGAKLVGRDFAPLGRIT